MGASTARGVDEAWAASPRRSGTLATTVDVSDASRVFVGGLPEDVTEVDVGALFEAEGVTVLDVELPLDRGTGRRRGFSVVTLGSVEEAARASGVLDGKRAFGRVLSVRALGRSAGPKLRARPGTGPGVPNPRARDAGASSRLFLGNLPHRTTVAELTDLLSRVGPIVRIHLPTDALGRPRGFGFATMGSPALARAAVAELRGVSLHGRRLSVSLATPRAAAEAVTPADAAPAGSGEAGSGEAGASVAPSVVAPEEADEATRARSAEPPSSRPASR